MWLKYLTSCIFLLSLLTSIQPSRQELLDECRTPKSEDGLCIKLLDCESLSALLPKTRNNTSDRDYLRNSHCGGSGREVRVCCPKSEVKDEILPDFSSSKGICGLLVPRGLLGSIEAELDEFPWTVQLLYTNLTTNSSTSECSGSLINRDHIITAAHCVNSRILDSKKLRLTTIRLGEWNSSSALDCVDDPLVCADPAVDISIDTIFEHENFDPLSLNKENDIAIIRLKEKANYTDFIRPICLPIMDVFKNKNYDGYRLELTGWGLVEGARSVIKLRANVGGISNQNCSELYNVTVNSKQLCFESDFGLGNCAGDGGSPLMSIDNVDNNPSYFLTGITTFGPDSCQLHGKVGVFTRVDQFTPWILEKVSSPRHEVK